jgi:hypothetical protein
VTNGPDPGVEPDRGLVRDVLSGTITPESDPWVFAEDALLFAVRRLEEDDPEWLLAQLADRSIAFERRRAVFAGTLHVRAAAERSLRLERPRGVWD